MPAVKKVRIKRGKKKSSGSSGGSQTRGNSHGSDGFLSYRSEFLFPGQPQERLPDHSRSQERRGAKPI